MTFLVTNFVLYSHLFLGLVMKVTMSGRISCFVKSLEGNTRNAFSAIQCMSALKLIYTRGPYTGWYIRNWCAREGNLCYLNCLRRLIEIDGSSQISDFISPCTRNMIWVTVWYKYHVYTRVCPFVKHAKYQAICLWNANEKKTK